MATLRNITMTFLLAADQRDASETGSSNDMVNAVNLLGRRARAALSIGAVTGTTPTLDVIIQQDTTSGFSSPTAVATFTQATTIGSETINVALIGERYVRAVGTLGGTSPVFDYAVVLLTENKLT